MDEVDKIIIYSLKELGCPIDDDEEDFSMSGFTPDLFVCCVSICLQEIKANPALPKHLPAGMAQRFTVASTLAKEMADCGYRSDIGYQTFLYPNIVDVRRIFMFLIEKLPKDNRSTVDGIAKLPMGDYELLKQSIKDKMSKQMRSVWIPQYCRGLANRKYVNCSSRQVAFAPNLNLNVPGIDIDSTSTETSQPDLLKNHSVYQVPNLFQQVTSGNYDLISTVLHRNASDYFSENALSEDLIRIKLSSNMIDAIPTLRTQKSAATDEDQKQSISSEDIATGGNAEPSISALDKLNEEITNLKCQNDKVLSRRKAINTQLVNCRTNQSDVKADIEKLKLELKRHERICLILEDPEENVEKLEGLVQSIGEKRLTLEEQYQAYRQPMLEAIENLKTTKKAKNVQDVMQLRRTITQLEETLQEKAVHHANLTRALKSSDITSAPRKEYTLRILEFIGNIRKQRNDIFRVLDETRDLQKQLNAVSGQLERQFNYTDDLLFQSAKHDLHAKKAYKLLASLHSTCNELIELVSQTGNLTKEIRDLEVQIDREQLKNISLSLKQISSDISNFEIVIDSLQSEIKKCKSQQNQ